MKKAFTLIELLVVIAIIAILAAILFPVFAQAKDSAKKAQQISNTKQLALSAIMYTNDYDDLFPIVMFANSSGWTPVPESTGNPDALNRGARESRYTGSLQPYLKNRELFANQSARDEAALTGIGQNFKLNLQMNPYLQSWNASASPSVSQTVLFGHIGGTRQLLGRVRNVVPIRKLQRGFLTSPSTTAPPYRFERSGPDCDTLGVWTDMLTTDFRMFSNQAVFAYADGSARAVSTRSNRYPWILNQQTGYLESYWINSADNAAGCSYPLVLAPTVEYTN